MQQGGAIPGEVPHLQGAQGAPQPQHQERGVILDTRHATDWIVPRRVMCAFFWTGIIMLFTGVILLVTGRHKGK